MRARILGMAVAVTMALLGLRATAQEIIATPDPVGGTRIGPGAGAQVVDPARSTSAANNWRFRWHEGRWWYWTPQHRWMWYNDDGRWVEYDASHAPLAADQNGGNPAAYDGGYPSPGYYYPSPAYYYPGPRYWGGYYYPGVAVGVRPYGNVSVGVGRAVGVDVWGPHGGVRVGRILVGW